MAKTLQTRIKNKIDTLSNWTTQNKVLLDGEIAIVKVPTGSTYTNPVTGKAEPVVELLMKVGNGTSTFTQLPWVSSKAADVYDWAKAASVEFSNEKIVFKNDAGTAIKELDLSTFATDSALDQTKSDLSALSAKVDVNKVSTAISNAINALDSTTDGSGNFVTNVVQTNGKVAVTKGSLPTASAGTQTAGIVKLGVTGGAATFDAVKTLTDEVDAIESDVADLKGAIAGGVHFRGTVTAEPTSSTTTVNGKAVAAGDVVIYDGKEYIYTGSAWEQLGDVTRIGNLETKVKNLEYSTENAVASTHKFASQVTQTDGKISVIYTQPDSNDVKYNNTNDTVTTKIEALAAEVANKASSTHAHGNITNDGKLGTANCVVITDKDKKVTVSSITTTKLGYLTDVTSNIQAQLNAKGTSNLILGTTSTTAAAGNHTHGDLESDISALEGATLKLNANRKIVYGTDTEELIIDCGTATINCDNLTLN